MISVKIDLHTDLSAVALGVPVVQNEARPITMSETLLNLLEEYRISKRPESYNLMKQTLEEFFALTRKNILSIVLEVPNDMVLGAGPRSLGDGERGS